MKHDRVPTPQDSGTFYFGFTHDELFSDRVENLLNAYRRHLDHQPSPLVKLLKREEELTKTIFGTDFDYSNGTLSNEFTDSLLLRFLPIPPLSLALKHGVLPRLLHPVIVTQTTCCRHT